MKVFIFIMVCIVCAVLIAAETNYQMALYAAEQSEGTDAAIEATMGEYGFAVTAFDEEPTMATKVSALTNTLL